MDDWESTTKIGQNFRNGGGQKKTTGGAGSSGTEKKGTAVSSQSKGVDYQRLYKIENADGPVKPKTVSKEVGIAIQEGRKKLELKQDALAAKAGIDKGTIAKYEQGTGAYNGGHLARLEKILKVHLRGEKIGTPTQTGEKKKTPAEKRAEEEAAKKEKEAKAEAKAEAQKAAQKAA